MESRTQKVVISGEAYDFVKEHTRKAGKEWDCVTRKDQNDYTRGLGGNDGAYNYPAHLGIVGEMAFAAVTGLPMQSTGYRKNGDGGHDFVIKGVNGVPLNVDVKLTGTNRIRIKVEQYGRRCQLKSDIYIGARLITPRRLLYRDSVEIEFYGFILLSDLRSMPSVPSTKTDKVLNKEILLSELNDFHTFLQKGISYGNDFQISGREIEINKLPPATS